MDDKEERKGTVIIIGSGASEETRKLATALAEKSGISVNEACDNLSKAMQFLSESVDMAMETLERLSEALIETCESCIEIIDRRTRHGSSSRTEKPREARIVIKWCEKYRPP